MLTVAKAAEELGLTARRIRQMCESGELKAEKLGRDWLIERESVERAKEGRE